MKILETTGDLELCTSLPLINFRSMTVMSGIEHDPVVEDCDSEMTQPTRKAIIKQVNFIDLIVAMFNNLSLDDKRKIQEFGRNILRHSRHIDHTHGHMRKE
eukprot:XP_016659563.1 PREDICTED: uncharacterized protein LOC107883644 [Acyrthosiphon pisum]